MKKVKIYIWVIGILILVTAIFFILGKSRTENFEAVNNFDKEILIYKSSSCGCCGLYGDYFKNRGNPKANVLDIEDVDVIKEKYGIPVGMRSCHTTIIGDYFVEGHIPLEAVEKLLNDKPDIAGIAMPGMPSGSPGMPGAKTGDFVIYAIGYDGSYNEFMRL